MEKELANKPLTLRSHTRWDFIGGANTEDKRDSGSTPGQGRSPGGGHGNPLQYSSLENPHGQKSLVGYNPCGRRELDMTERLSTTIFIV